MKRACLAGCVALAFSFALGAARADEAAGPADEAIAHGVALRRERKDSEALAEFRRAYALSPTPRALAQIALAEAALERWVSAESDLLHVLVADDPWVTHQRDALTIALKQMQAHLGTLDVIGPDGAQVWIDGELAARLPSPALRVVAKRTAMEVRAPGFETVKREVTVSSGATAVERVSLEPLPAAQPKIVVPPQALLAGTGEQVSPGSSRRAFAWGAAGASALFLAGGVTATLVASSAASHYDGPECGHAPSVTCAGDASRVRTMEALEWVGYGAAAVSAGVAGYLFLTGDEGHEKSGILCAPSALGVNCMVVY